MEHNQSNVVLYKEFKQKYALPLIFLGSVYFALNYLLPKGDANHFDYFKFMNWTFFVNNCIYYFELFNRLFLWYSGNIGLIHLGGIVIFIVFIVFIIGLLKSIKENMVFVIFFLINLWLLLVWPSNQGVRLILPIFPIYVALFFVGLNEINNKLKWTLNMALYGFNFIILLQAVVCLLYYQNNSTNQAYSKEAIDMYTFIRENTPESSIIQFSKPRLIYYETTRLSVNANICGGKSIKIDYIVLEKGSKPFSVIHERKLVYSNGKFEIYN